MLAEVSHFGLLVTLLQDTARFATNDPDFQLPNVSLYVWTTKGLPWWASRYMLNFDVAFRFRHEQGAVRTYKFTLFYDHAVRYRRAKRDLDPSYFWKMVRELTLDPEWEIKAPTYGKNANSHLCRRFLENSVSAIFGRPHA